MHAIKQQGNVGELRAALDLAKAGASIFKEIGESSRCDLVAEIDGSLLKVQVKSVSLSKGGYEFTTRKTTTRYNYNYSKKDADLFAIHCVDDDVVAWVSSEECIKDEGGCFSIKLRPIRNAPKNNQKKGVIYLEDFLCLARALKTLRRS